MRPLPEELTLHTTTGIDGIDARTFYGIAQLREMVFVVEQECPYLELDGRDLEASTVQLWAADAAGRVAATVRVLNDDHDEPGLRRIGRVVTHPDWRGRGVAAAVMAAAIETCDGGAIQIDAQSHLAGWYAGFGFEANGPEFVEDGIPHTPMRRSAVAAP